MSYLYVCNTASDWVSKVDTEKLEEVSRIILRSGSGGRVGPHGICAYKDKILVANNYSNTISIINANEQREVESYYIGMHCNDVAVYNDEAYIICGELNNMVVFDLIKRKLVEEIPCGNLPHSISIDKKNKIAIISNMRNDSITLIDCSNRENVKNINVGQYPTQALFMADGNNALICESNIGSDSKGSISVLSMKSFKIINRIPVGNSPVDMYCSKDCCYVSNFGDGTISIIDVNKYKVKKRINVGGMPRGIVYVKKYMYIGDNYNNTLLQVDMQGQDKKTIAIGKEPTGMTIV